jgi:nucleotide-binding universal stress UspA family protein
MKVLATTDGSDCSREALDQLGRIVAPATTEVLLLTAYPGPSSAIWSLAGPPYLDLTEYAREVREEAARIVQEGERRLTAQGFGVRTLLVEGDPAAAILDAAARERVDLIVVGSHGRTGLARFLLGSVSSRVVSHAACSVLVVK